MAPDRTYGLVPALTRRRALLLAAGAAASALVPARAKAQGRVKPLRRIVDLGPGGVITPGSAGDLRFHDNRRHLRETGTTWVRLWADWPSLQPDPAIAIDDLANPGAFRLQGLDEQIAAACEDGLQVLLMPYRFPVWANGTAELAAVRNTDAEAAFDAPDRMSAATWRRYEAAGRDPRRYNPSRRALEFRIPDEGVGDGTAWAGFLEFLYARYHPQTGVPGRMVHGLELVNEPNFQLWPQRGPAPGEDPFATGPLTVQHTMAQFMAGAQAVAARQGDVTMIFAPSTADSEVLGRTVTPFLEFSAALLDALDALGYVPSPQEAWAHHNYTDLERRLEDTGTQKLRAILKDRWLGYVDGADPTVFLTEGGVRLTRMRDYYPAEDPLEAQARSIALAGERHARDDGPGEGVAMLAQYTLYADPRFDTGLLDPWPSTQVRPSYGAWAAIPSRP